MPGLLDETLAAHSGLDRGKKIEKIEADASIYGAMWVRKGHGDVLRDVHITARRREQWISYSPFVAIEFQSSRFSEVLSYFSSWSVINEGRTTAQVRWSGCPPL